MPYLAGSLLLLESTSLMHQLGSAVTAGLLAAWPGAIESLGRVVVVFALNEVLANGLGLAMRGGLVRRWRAPRLAVGRGGGGSRRTLDRATGIGRRGRRLASGGTRDCRRVGHHGFSGRTMGRSLSRSPAMIMDAIHGKSPGPASLCGVPLQGMKKGMVYSGVFMAILHGLDLLCKVPAAGWLLPALSAADRRLLAGAVLFPLAKTIIETFDGSQAFFRRTRASYRQPALYARGALIGLGVGYAILQLLTASATRVRAEFGCAVGIAAFGGVSLLRDGFYALRRRGRLQWRVYLVEAVFGGLIGAAIGFYLDAAQVSLVVGEVPSLPRRRPDAAALRRLSVLEQMGLHQPGQRRRRREPAVRGGPGGRHQLVHPRLAVRHQPHLPHGVFPPGSGADQGAVHPRRAGGPQPEHARSAPLGPVDVAHHQFVPPADGRADLVQPGRRHPHRGGHLPRRDHEPGGLPRLEPAVFIYLLAYDAVRILIWLDHMGLRVATLVNLSFLGMDRLDERLARFLGPAATAAASRKASSGSPPGRRC